MLRGALNRNIEGGFYEKGFERCIDRNIKGTILGKVT